MLTSSYYVTINYDLLQFGRAANLSKFLLFLSNIVHIFVMPNGKKAITINLPSFIWSSNLVI